MTKTPKKRSQQTTSLEQLPEEIRDVFICTAKAHNIVPENLWQRTRKDEIVLARHMAISIIRQNYGSYGRGRGYTLKRIAGFFNRDHTSIIHSCRIAEDLCDSDLNFNEIYKELRLTIQLMPKRPGMSNIINIFDKLSVANAIHAEKWLQDLLDAQTNKTDTTEQKK